MFIEYLLCDRCCLDTGNTIMLNNKILPANTHGLATEWALWLVGKAANGLKAYMPEA